MSITERERRAFESGASPAVGGLLAEITNTPPGAYRDGLERAVEILIESWSDSFHEAYRRGVEAGRRQHASG